jgi:hypothetical protein
VNLTETGESRVNGYLFVLGRSLKTYWIIPFSIACGVAVLALAHRATRQYLASWRKRRRAES